ncbi:MAG: glycosyltransferase [Bernardetiaceae bacterium]|jgi:glycosyltransferase involved in cell wall biosynthesis|nr:glycosyltransferase [Bernardetiaceae bacterium]
MNPPLVSIVTVTYNAAAYLEKTLRSVASQTYGPVEHLVIDGGSTDGTLELVKRAGVARWLSEPDGGIYDAMNKGLALARGQWVNFMNAGDEFCAPTTLAEVFAQDLAQAQVAYGHYRIVYQTFVKPKLAPDDLSGFWRGMALNHQSVFVRTALAQAHPFDLRYPLAADFAQLLGLYQAGHRFTPTGVWVANYADGGASAARKVEYLRQCLAVVQAAQPQNQAAETHYARLMAQTRQISRLQSWLPTWLFEGLMRLKNR